MGFIAPKPKGPSAEELRLAREREQRLQAEEKLAQQQADRERMQRLSERRASAAGLRGRRSLTATSELGVRDNLGA